MIGVVLLLLALTFGLHIVLVNLGIGLATTIPLLKRKREEKFVRVSKELMKFYISIYALAGVFGTAFTVFLLSFYPKFIGLAGHIAFTPFAIAILAIVLHFFAITAYWYGWERWGKRTHDLFGILMVVSVYLIPLGFRAVSAFLNVPAGLKIEPKLHLDVLEALSNQTFLPIYLKSVFAALSASFFAFSSGYMYRFLKRRDKNSLEISNYFMPYATVTLTLTIILGGIYAFSLYNSVPYKFNNAFGRDIWLFIVKMAAVSIQLLAAYIFFTQIKRGDLRRAKVIVFSGPAALIGVFAGEMLNSFSQYPYFVAKLGDVSFASALPESVRETLLAALKMDALNPLTTLPSLYMVTAVFLVPLLIAAAFFVYLILFAEERYEIPE